jgi:integrase
MKLTVKNIASQELESGKRDQIFFDDDIPGFGLRLREGGFKGLVFQYKNSAGKTRRINLGSVSAVNLPEARKTAEGFYARAILKQDPAAEIRGAKERAQKTFGAAAELFLASQKERLRPRTYVNVEHHINALARPLHDMELSTIKLEHIAGLLADVGQKRKTGSITTGGKVVANRLRASLSKMFRWAIAGALHHSANPVTGANRNDEKSRERVLADWELRAIWYACQDNNYGAIIKLLMLTGQRASEISALRRSEIVESEIRLPGARTKNNRAHTIPLSAPARRILSGKLAQKSYVTSGHPDEVVFGRGRHGFTDWTKSKRELDKQIATMTGSPLSPWRVHDLRRSVATCMVDIGIEPHVVEAVLNHQSGSRAGVAGIYNRAKLEPQKRIAMDRWAEQLLAWIEERESNVTALRA